MIPRLQTENELESFYPDADAASEQELMQIVSGQTTPTPTPTPFNPATFDWTQGTQNIGGFTYQPIYNSTGQGETFEQGPLTQVLRYREGETGVGKSYDILDPTTWQQSGTGQFKEVGNLGDMLQTAAIDLAPLATFALGVGPLGGMLGGSIASALGIPVAASAGAAGLSAAQVAALGSAAGSAGLGVLQGKDLGDVLEDAAKSVLPSLISTGLKLPDYQIPGLKEIVGNAFPDSVSDAVVRGAQDLASAAVKSVVTGQDLDVVNALLPSVVGEVTDVTGLPKPVVQLGIQSLLGGELTPEGIFKTIVQNAPKADIKNLKAEDEDTSPVTDTSLPAELDTAESDQDFNAFFPEFDAPLLTAPADQQVEVVAPAPQYTPEVLDLIQNIVQQEAALPADQQVEVVAPQAPVDVLDYLESLQPQPTPITPIEEFKFQEANVMPEGPQQVVTTAEKEAALPEVFTQPTPQDVQDYIQSVINAEAALPVDQTVTTTGTKLPDQTFYELPEAPAVQDLYQPPGVVEGPSKIDVTGKKYEPPIIPLEDIPEIKYPDILPQEPIYEQPPTPAPTPSPAPSPAPTPAPSPAPTPSPAPAPKAQSGFDPRMFALLLGMLNQQRPAAEPYQVAQIRARSPFGSILDEEQPSMDELLQLIGRG
jgi:hypothetical protein